MKTLILMRHAKSDWTHGVPDHARPLNARGVRGARAMGDWLRQQGHVPDEAIVSTAARTRETYSLLGFDGPVQFDASLYEASTDAMLDRLRRAGGATVLIVAHNPGTALLAHQLAAQEPTHDRWHDMPTTSTLIADFNIDVWAELATGAGNIAAFKTPNDVL